MATTLDSDFTLQLESARHAIANCGLDPRLFEISRTPHPDDPQSIKIKVRKEGAVTRIYSGRGGRDWLYSFAEDLRQGRFD
ncbi:hypothetical protein BH10PSE17_BH10PSE17_26290 [soil metagenome]